MSHLSSSAATASPLAALSLDVPSDAAFELQVRADARLRLRRAHQHQDHAQPGHAASSAAIPSTRSAHEKAHARKWKRTATAVALAAFGAGLLWPVAPAPESGAPQSSHSLRVLQGEQLASLDQPAQNAH